MPKTLFDCSTHSGFPFQSTTEQYLLANSVVGVVAVVTTSVDSFVCLVGTAVTIGAIEETVVEPLRNMFVCFLKERLF